MKKKMVGLGIAVALLAGCGGPQQDMQMIRQGAPTATVSINNTADFTVGVVTFQDCETRAFARPQPQTIAPGSGATYTVSEGCYFITAGEAGLSFKFLADTRIVITAGDTVVLP